MDGPKSPPGPSSVASGSPSGDDADSPDGSVADAGIEAEATLSSETSAYSSTTASSEEEIERSLGFPSHSLQKLNDGLNRGGWVVHIGCLVDCEKAAAALIKHPDRGGMRDLEIVRKFIRGPLTDAFEKVLLDSAITGWNDNLQLQIFDAVTGLVDLTAAKLSQHDIVDEIDVAQAIEDEADLMALLEPLMHAFDSDSMFNFKNAESALPAKMPRELPSRYAKPRPPDASPLLLSDPSETDVQDCSHFETFSWPAYFINYFGYRKGFHHMHQAMTSPTKLSMELLKHMLLVMAACLSVATNQFVDSFEKDLEEVLTFIEDAIEQNVEQLSEGGSDRMFQHLSTVFHNLFLLLGRAQTPFQADELVGIVQRKFVLQMLSFSNFNKHLSAVRETHALVKRAVDLSKGDQDGPMQQTTAWLKSHNVVGQLLRANLHQKQYVDQVQKVLRYLVAEDSLQQDHIALLWDLTEKPDTFEAVRINVFNMLAELAQSFNEDQLDFLFKKFESSAARRDGGNKQGMVLLFRLAKVDTQGVMTKRILGLLWRISLVSHVPAPLDMAMCFAGVLRDYALTNKSPDTRALALDIVSQLVQELNGGDKALPAMRVLHHLISNSGNHAKPFLDVLKRNGDIFQLLLGSLQRFMSDSREMRQHKQSALGAWQHYHNTAVMAFSSFLLDLAERLTDEPLTWPFIKGFWESLVEGALVQSDKDIAFDWFYNVLQDTQSISGRAELYWVIIDRNSSQLLVTEKMARLDPCTMSESGYRCFAAYFNALAEEKRKDSKSDLELDLPGVDFLWRVVLDMPSREGQLINSSHAVVRASQEMLIRLYQRHDRDSPLPAVSAVPPQLCTHFVRSCVNNLMTAVNGTLVQGNQHAQQLSAQRAARCMQLLQAMIRTCRGRTMPTQASHAASYVGSPLRVNVTAPNIHAAKCQLDMNSNSYVGQLRQQIASRPAFNIPPQRLRMFLGGKELLNDAFLLQEAGFTQDQCVVNVTGVQIDNTYSTPNPALLAAQEAASPALLLAREHAGVYPVLLTLADFSGMPAMREYAVQLLGSLPTYSQVVEALSAALHSPQPAQNIMGLLYEQQPGGTPNAKPARLHYTLQALSSMLQPQGEMLRVKPEPTEDMADETKENIQADAMPPGKKAAELEIGSPQQPALLDPGALQQVVLQSGALEVILDAVKAAGMATAEDVGTIRVLYSTAHDMAHRLVKSTVQSAASSKASSPDIYGRGQRPASAVPASPMSIQAAEGDADDVAVVPQQSGLSPTKEEQTVPEQQSLQQPRFPPQTSPRGSTTSSPTHRPSAPTFAANAAPSHVALKALFFFMHEMAQAARGWGQELTPAADLAQDDTESNVLPEVDMLMTANALTAAWDLLLCHPLDLLQPLLQSQDIRGTLITSILSDLHGSVRSVCQNFLMRVGQLTPNSHLWVLQLLAENMPKADSKPQHCSCYYDLFAWALTKIPKDSQVVFQEEVRIAEQLLSNLVALLPELNTLDDSDRRMQGKLELTLQLSRALGSRGLASTDSKHLVRLLLTEYLFPEAQLKVVYSSLREVPPRQLRSALMPRCSSQCSRLAALKLLTDLSLQSAANLQTGLQLVSQLHLPDEDPAIHDNMPLHSIRSPLSTFVGLKNGGATCYMNSVFQQLFMQPSIRKMLLAVPESAEDQSENVFFQMQNMFANLALTNQDHYIPRPFWNAFKDYDGQRLNLREHQDAYEFFTRLQDTADQYLRDRRLKPVMQAVIGGKFAQQIICRGVPYRSEKEEEFYQLSLDVRGKSTLEESLDLYVQGELMEGDNQYLCEEAGKKVDAVKRSCIKSLPHTLVIHLKRFEFDYETMTRWKIKDRFEFPQQLDMYKYTVEGLAEAEQAEAGDATTPDSCPQPTPRHTPRSRLEYQYELKGIVVHSGTAFAGHYYSFIKARTGDGCPSSHGQWYCFDDVNVEPWDITSLDKDCFGGKYTLNPQNYKGAQQEFDRPNSAYMLFYERSESLEPFDQPATPLASPKVPTDPAQHQQPLSLQSAQAAASQQLHHSSPSQAQSLAAGLPQESSSQQSPDTVMQSPMQQAMSSATPAAQQMQRVAEGQDQVLPSFLVSPQVMQTACASPADTPEAQAPQSNVSPLKGVSTLDLGQDTVMEAADQEVVQSSRPSDLKPCSTVGLPDSMPSPIYEGVMASNLQLLRETHLMDRDYFKYILNLVKASSEICYHKIRRTGAADEAEKSVGSSSRPSDPSRRTEDADSMATLAAGVAITFLFQIYLRNPLSPREDLAEWRSVLQNIMESSAAATRLVLSTVSRQTQQRGTRYLYLEDTILLNLEDVRDFASGVVFDALKTAVTFHGGAYDANQEPSQTNSMPAAVNKMITGLIFAGHFVLHDERIYDQAYYAHLMLLFKDYGGLGPLQRQHLTQNPFLAELATSVAETLSQYSGGGEQHLQEVHAPLQLLAMLFRRADLQDPYGLNQGHHSSQNPYREKDDDSLSPGIVTPVSVTAIAQMCKPDFITDANILKALQYLMWENVNLTLKVIDHLTVAYRKCDGFHLYQLAQHYAQLLIVDDSLKTARLRHFLVMRGSNSNHQEDQPGLVGLVLHSRQARNAWRRVAVLRLLDQVVKGTSSELLEEVRRTFPAALSNQSLSYVFQSLLQEKFQPRQEINVRNLLQRLMCTEPGEGTD